MSDHIPFEIQSEIIKRLPVKSVVQFRSVSKLWKSLIDSPKFIKTYHSRNTHLFVKYKIADELKYVSIADDDTFPNHKFSPTVPHPVSLVRSASSLVSSVSGLLCFYGSRRKHAMGKKIAVLWNPSVGKAVGITISNSLQIPTIRTFVGFGVCPNTSDPKLVRINTIGLPTVNWEVEVFTLTARVWKTVSNISPTIRTIHLSSNSFFVEGFLYWRACRDLHLGRGNAYFVIISFDIKSDEFGVVSLPSRLSRGNPFMISKVYESLGLFEYYTEDKTRFCDVWIMKEGVTKSFNKILSIKALDTWGLRYKVLQLRKNGEAIIENIDDDDTNLSALKVYDTNSGSISGMGINGAPSSFSMISYMETLLLLDESNSIIH